MPYTLLVADRDPLQFELFDLIFHGDGYALQTFTDGQDVLAYLREHTPDVAILETDLPSVDGFDLCRKMKSVKRLREVPIVLVTSRHATLTDEIKGVAKIVKADLIIPKPLGDKNLRERIRSLLAGRTPHAAEREPAEPTPTEPTPNAQPLRARANDFAEKLQTLNKERQRLHAALLPTDRSQEPKEMKKLRALVEVQEAQIEVLEAQQRELGVRLAQCEKQREEHKEPSRLRRWLT